MAIFRKFNSTFFCIILMVLFIGFIVKFPYTTNYKTQQLDKRFLDIPRNKTQLEIIYYQTNLSSYPPSSSEHVNSNTHEQKSHYEPGKLFQFVFCSKVKDSITSYAITQ